MIVPIDQRKWKDIPAVDYVDLGSLSFSVPKTMTRILRHRGLHRVTDGAMGWDIWLHVSCRDFENAPRRTNFEWLSNLHKRTDKKRFQHCLNSDGFFHNMRAIHGRSVGNKS